MRDWRKKEHDVTDEEMLRAILDSEREPELHESEREAFPRMLEELRSGARKHLSPRQREWVMQCYQRLGLEADEAAENLVSAGKVPIGRPVIMPAVLDSKNLPKRPPGRS